MHQKRKELIELGKRRSERDPAVQAALDGLKAQVKADLKRQRGIAMKPQTPPSEAKPRAAASGPTIARFLAIAERHVAGTAPKGDDGKKAERRTARTGGPPNSEL